MSLTLAAGFALRAPAMSWMTAARAALRAWNNARITRRELMRLDDHALCDLGLTRADIDRVAKGLRPR